MREICKHIVRFLLLFCLLWMTSQVDAQNNKGKAADKATAGKGKQLPKSVTVSGIITDAATAKPVAGIQLSYKDFTAAITDSTGNFSLQVPNYDVSITVNGEGYQTKEIALKGRTKVSAALYEDAFNSIYDISNIPFGAKPKSQLVKAVGSVPSQGNWTHNTETPSAWLQGNVAGLQVTRRSGTPNIGANLYLRGFSSLYATNQPLIIVDGVIFDNNSYGNSIINGHVDNPLADIDTKDIENITVIKDGSSTYGTRAANGVIIISTARAHQLPTRIDFAAYAGVNLKPAKLPVMNASDYRTYISDLLKTKGLSDQQIQAYPFMNDDPASPLYYNYHSDNNWQDQVFSNSIENSAFLRVSGGDNVARYALSMGIMKNHGVLDNTNLTRYNTRFNADFNFTKRLTATTNLSFTFNDQKFVEQGISPETNPLYTALIKAPFVSSHVVSATGAVSPAFSEADTLGISNPVALITNLQDFSKTYRFFGSISLDYKISSSLDFITQFGITLDKVRESFFVPGNGVVHDKFPSGVTIINRSGSQVKDYFSIYSDSRLAWHKTYNSIHQLSAALGVRYNQVHSEQDIGLGFNSPTDQFVTIGQGLASLKQTGGSINDWKWLNSYLHADYGLLDKYFLAFNMAADASSRFGNQVSGAPNIGGYSVALLPSLGASWIVSSEKFMSTAKWIELLKLRATASLTGNDDIGNYNNRLMYVSQNLLVMEGLVRGNISNPALQWEKNTKINAGIDAAFMKERLNVSVDVYQNKTSRMLIYQPQIVAAGLDTVLTNTGGMQTTGIDLSISGRIINRRSLKWDLGITLATYKNKITSLPNDPIFTQFAGATYITTVGKTANLFYGYRTNGVYTSDAAAAADGLMKQMPNGAYVPFAGGDVRFVDVNGDKVIDDKDRQVIGNPNPDFYGSISSKVTWKRFSLDLLFTFSKGNDIYNYTRYQLESESGPANQLQSVLNRWRANGQVTNVPKATWGDPMGNSSFSDRWIEDGSYFRLRNASVSYDVPIRAGFFKYAIVYVSGNNLLTLTKYKGYDPEFSATGSVFGQGVDLPMEPLFRSAELGLRIGL